jgi:cytidylate kinase
MAVITISRQVAALGDEIAAATAKKLGYTFVGRQAIEKRILELGFPAEQLKRYDERKPGFFASLAKERDEYLDYLQTAILEAAEHNNCVLIGRGAFVILSELPHRISLRLIADDEVRLARLKHEFAWNEKQAKQRITESDSNRAGFHKTFFNLSHDLPHHFHGVINTALVDIEGAAQVIAELVKYLITPENEKQGRKTLDELLKAQHLVNRLIFEHRLNIFFLRAVIQDSAIYLQGIADSAALAEKAVSVASSIMKDYTVKSAISIVQDFKAYP